MLRAHGGGNNRNSSTPRRRNGTFVAIVCSPSGFWSGAWDEQNSRSNTGAIGAGGAWASRGIDLRFDRFVRHEGVEEQEAGTGDDAAIGEVEVGPVIAEDVDFNEVYD